MNFIDDEADASEDDEVLVPSSQPLQSSQSTRPNKRRRLNRFPDLSDDEASNSASDEYDLPSNEDDAEDDFDNPRSKYDAVLHVPAFAESQSNEFVTQVEQPWSSPTAIRGPRWRKKDATPRRDTVSPTRTVNNVPAPTHVVSNPRLTDSSRPVIVDEFDDGDAELFQELLADEAHQVLDTGQAKPRCGPNTSKSMRQTTLFGMNTTQRNPLAATQSRTHNWPMASRNELPTHHKINKTAMQTWTYPLNVGAIRDYQFNIVYRALFHNILVALPTGLGKTFIAATVMLNFFDWTQDSQIIFVAPTKPLVTQQVDACFRIAGIPRSQTTLLTGEIQPAIRAEEWQEKRVFFMTPQTLINDLKAGLADPKKIVLLVVDEAHKATGNYAYVEIVRFLRRFNSSFRVLALTATPGANVEAVQKVIDGLDIARVEIRTEESMDIRNFVHARNENVELFDNSEEVEMCLDLFATAVRPVLAKVNGLNAYFSNDPKTMTLYGLMKGREQWIKSDAGRNSNWGLKGMVQQCFKPLMSLAHNLELLKYHGIGPFYHKMRIFDDEAYGNGKYAKQIVESESYKTLMTRLHAWINDDDFVGHPKLTYLNEVVLNHFMDAGDGLGAASGRPPSDTRIMVFAHYRDSAEEIVRILRRHQPMVRPHVFVGQSGTKGSEGMDQKTQIDIIKKFKAGIYNTLVATSIGEEGLDIGEVDLIVCYDCSKSPIRMLQRMGRTGRKRAGNIVLLLMRGKEERDYHAAKDNYLKMQAIIESGKDFNFHEDASPRIVPREIQPIVDKRHVDIPIENTQVDTPEPRRKKAKNAKRPPKKFHMPDDVETGFQFLGKSTKKQVKKVSVIVPEPKRDQVEATLPPLLSVLLSEKEEEDLERRYAQVAGDQTQYIQAVRLDTFPRAIHASGKTSLVKHSTATQRIVQASKIMRNKDKAWQRPVLSGIIENFQSDPAHARERVHSDLGGRNTPARGRSSTVGSTTTAGHQSDDYDLEDDFVDDRPLRQTMSSSNATSVHGVNAEDSDHVVPDNVLNTPFYVSQQSVQGVESEVEDLPDMDKILSKPAASVMSKNALGSSQLSAKPKRRMKRPKRVVSDDSDD